MNKIVIIVPAQTAQGGISNYYQIIRNYFDERVVYLYRGSRNYPYKKNVFVETWRIIKDYLLFCKILSQHDVKLVQTTTALTYKSVIRDGIYIFLAKLFGKKTIVFYRGWDIELEKKISKSILFKSIFLKTNASIVLSNYQYKWLKERNVNNIFHSTTIIDDKFINYIKEKEIVKKYNGKNNRKIKLLFLARLEKEKGIFELIEAYSLIKTNFELIVAGDGTIKNEVEEYVKSKKITNIRFVGFVSGKKKISVFKEADIYVFPSYSEGMPNSVLEAMAMGLPVLTTKVGGLVDFLEEGKHGFFIEKYSTESIIDKVNELNNNKKLMLDIGLNNHRYAKENFVASKVAKRNMDIFKEVINKE